MSLSDHHYIRGDIYFVPMLISKMAILEFCSTANKKKVEFFDPRNVQKLLKSVHLICMTKFLRVLVNFSVKQTCLLHCDCGSNAVVLNTQIVYFRATLIFTFGKVFQISKWRPR